MECTTPSLHFQGTCMCAHVQVHMCVCVCVCVCACACACACRKRPGASSLWFVQHFKPCITVLCIISSITDEPVLSVVDKCVCVCLYIYTTYIYIYTHT